jgi:2-succinyl-5-enolpyruvyl-6-hydroxy-3-cyclohexene-1-carboxylate synthase
MIVVGENIEITDVEKKLFERFFDKYNCIYSVETISNYKGKGSVVTYKATETGAIWGNEKIVPDIVISLGNYIASYKLKELLKNNHEKIENWIVNESGCVRDPYKCLNKIFECSTRSFFEKILSYETKADSKKSYYEEWKILCDNITFDNQNFSSLNVASILAKNIPDNSILHSAILNSTRIMQFSDFKDTIKYYSNLGALGIDGCVATFIGQSLVTNKLSYLLIGDLSFFYGLNAASIRGIKNNVRIILLNNGGGEEFKIKLPYVDMDKFVCAQCKRNAQGSAESFGFKYFTAQTNVEVEKVLKEFAKPSEKPMFLEVYLDIDNDSKIIRNFYSKYNKQSSNISLKNIIGNMLPDKTKSSIKTLFNK